MKKQLLSLAASIGMLFAGQKAMTTADATSAPKPVSSSPIVEAAQKPLSAEVQLKLNKIFSNIKSSPEKKQDIKDLLTQMASYDIGREVIMNVPDNVKIQVKPKAEIAKTGAAAYHKLGVVTMSDAITTDDIGRKTEIMYLAHELKHANQYKEDILNNAKVDEQFSLRHAAFKLAELETAVQDAKFSAELFKNNPENMTERAKYYLAERTRYEKDGMSATEAEKAATSSLQRAFWSNGMDLPDNHSEISSGLKQEINTWNSHYDSQSIDGNSKMNSFGAIVRTIADIGVSRKSADDIVSAYATRMGGLPTDYFVNYANNNVSAIGTINGFLSSYNGEMIQNFDNNHNKVSSVKISGDKIIENKFAPDGKTWTHRKILSKNRVIQEEMGRSTDGVMQYHGVYDANGLLSELKCFDKDGKNYQLLHYENGKETANKGYFNANGNPLSGIFENKLTDGSVRSQECKGGLVCGIEKTSYPNGCMSVANNISGKYLGDAYTYNKDGTVNWKGSFNENGLRDGNVFSTENDQIVMTQWVNGNPVSDPVPCTPEQIAELNRAGQEFLAEATAKKNENKETLTDTIKSLQQTIDQTEPSPEQMAKENMPAKTIQLASVALKENGMR